MDHGYSATDPTSRAHNQVQDEGCGGLMCSRLCLASHVLCSVLYICAGAVQLIAGIFFLISLPVFKIGSNLWTGGWNVVAGVGGAVFSCVGEVTVTKHRALLYLTLSVTIVNVINLLVLELGEWRILMPDPIKKLIHQKHLKTLVFYARTTTSISTAVAAVTSFIDAQLMFWWLERCLPAAAPIHHNETVSDIEYIIPRVKSGSMGKNNSHNNMNQYAQSWVFDSDTVGSSQSDSPYTKLPPAQLSGSKTVVLRRKAPPTHVRNETAPVVLVEGSTDVRELPFMTSFSRTPSPVPDDTASLCSNPPAIYECLERLTEPSVYRARLNTAIGTAVDRVSPSVSPRPHSAVVNDQVHYASLMVELNRTIETKFPPSPHTASRRESAQKSSTSDTEFSKELEAALQLIQDLESPITEPPERSGKQCVIHNEGNKTIISLTPQKKYTSVINIVPPDSDDTKEFNEIYNSTLRTKEYNSCFPAELLTVENDRCGTLPPKHKGVSKHKSFKELNNNSVVPGRSSAVVGRSVSLTDRDWSRPRWSLKTLLKRKPSQLKLTPELESAILKSESLAHLTELELIARYDQNKLLQRARSQKFPSSDAGLDVPSQNSDVLSASVKTIQERNRRRSV